MIQLTKTIGLGLNLGLLLMLSACSEPQTSHQSISMGKLMGPTQNNDQTEGDATYTQVDKNRAIVFPQDHLSHPDFRQEWWYLTANLETAQGEKLGLQWTQFRIALTPENSTKIPIETLAAIKVTESDWVSKQIYMTHAAVTTKDEHFAEERWSRQHPQLADVSAEPLTIKIDDWQWTGTGNMLFPATLAVAGDQFSYQLTLDSSAPYQRQGEQGYSVKSADGSVASHYYSQPFIQISGQVTLQGESQSVTGKAWLDREWSSQFLNKTQAGWDWFALRLDDGSTLMLFQLRGQTDTDTHFYSGRRMFANGSGRNIASKEIAIKASSWHKIDSTRYPTSWQLNIPSENIDLEIDALNPNAKMPLSIPYWEGPVLISGSHKGEGYMELTGY
ncbi:carotenoid 1,2-hydratase [Shewanella hanedai]|uniref:Carotenoid 1,2-hydratase n=1 Tax=Shewanella hanedai TaxID=25 RepID=A0A553JUU2_SHEHA|nr:lipocalin-like domain-containing protein [Shewanella hanedai]TRY16227.1 carotenoid 1,2-hydratase [Shewanella hanedai]GGI67262.1 carotenoid 1,2-hydratase [Shewanella hanedai]